MKEAIKLLLDKGFGVDKVIGEDICEISIWKDRNGLYWVSNDTNHSPHSSANDAIDLFLQYSKGE